MNTKSIIVQLIDCQQIVLFGTTHLLQQDSRFSLSSASNNGDAAIKAAIQHQPDVIVLEPDLPEEDGLHHIHCWT